MRISVRKRYEQTITRIFQSLSLGFFLLLVHLVTNPISIIGRIFLVIFAFTSPFFIIRSLYLETKTEIFDLTSPTIFENGLLVFQSQRGCCAIFFTFHLSLSNFEVSSALRGLTILLKLMPTSTILALERTAQEGCFINFYIKLDKSSFLARARELHENIHSSFKKILGDNHVRLLNREELINHFSLGTSGQIHKINISGKSSLQIHSDIISKEISLAQISPIQTDSLIRSFKVQNDRQNIRLILPIKKAESNIQISNSLTLIADKPIEHLQLAHFPAESSRIEIIPSSTSIRILGDILSRNWMQDNEKTSTIREAADFITHIIKTIQSTPTTDFKSESIQKPHTEEVTPLAWREFLTQQVLQLDLAHEMNAMVILNNFPTRIDAIIGEQFFVIISKAKDDQIQWLVKKFTHFLETHEQKWVIFLTSHPLIATLIQKELTKSSIASRSQVFFTKPELEKFLKNLKNQLQSKEKRIVQVA